jgi:hypothetical protein
MIQAVLRLLAVLGALLLAGCAANQMPGFQNTYYSYNVPESLLEQIRIEFRDNGLPNARIVRDNVGRVQLKGSYKNEDEVDYAFIIVQSIVGIKSTSPFYPADIRETRWGTGAGKALVEHAKTNRAGSAKPQKRALVIGINTFRDAVSFLPVPGEDDAVVAKNAAEKAGYMVTALLGNDATKANIEAALSKIEGDLGPDDSLFIFISSHGTQPLPVKKGGDGRKMSIVAWDSSPYKNGKGSNLNIQKTSVSDIEVQKLAKKPTKNTRILIDTCYSGEMLKYVSDDSRRYILQTNGGQPERAGIALSSWTGQEYSSKAIHFNDESTPALSTQANDRARQKNLKQDPVELSRAYTIITATSEGELSWAPHGNFAVPDASNKMFKGSLFTQAFFAYLDKFKGQVEPAFESARLFTQNQASKIAPPKGWVGPVHQVPRNYSTASADQSNL